MSYKHQPQNAEMAILVSDKIEFKTKKIFTRDKDGV